MRTTTRLVAALLAVFMIPVAAQTPEPAPAFPGQTDAPPPARPSAPFNVETIATGLTGAWAVAFLPDGNYLITQNGGTMRLVKPNGFVSAPLAGVPGVKTIGAHGLHDLLLDPDFARNRTLYFTYFAPPPGEAPGAWPLHFLYEDVWTKSLAERRLLNIGMEKVARARLSEDNQRLENVRDLADGAERRIQIGRDGNLLVTGADRFRFYDSDLDGNERNAVLDPDERRNFTGGVLRVGRDGSIPKDNPFLGRANVSPWVYAFGLKDPEGAAIHPVTGDLWVVDHGPQGGDEINIVRAGRDFGWPDVTYGRQYDARQTDGRKNVKVGTGNTSMKGVEEPIYYWVPSIGPSGMTFYTGDQFPEWKGNLFIGAMPGQHLVRLVLNGDRVVAEEKLLVDRKQRIREVRQGPDGNLYIFLGTDLVRLTPKK
ncbi:MAG TPA: PQQ-dependent sugar dehydrogenase [Vicinamibacterales bacterium]|nr:PQQ-dependent sugar dehydrogenase [Vicinamibacterales bacterium]